MDRITIILCIIVVAFVGLIKLRRVAKQITEQAEFADEFIQNLSKFVESGGKDGEAYSWMWLHAEKMQFQLGRIGIASAYRPPFSSYMLTNYAIILNILPELRKSVGMYDDAYREYSSIIMECILRYLGVLQMKHAKLDKKLSNPLAWFREGVKLILAVPFEILLSFGIISVALHNSITESGLFRILLGAASLVSLISAIIGLILGWEAFTRMVLDFIYSI